MKISIASLNQQRTPSKKFFHLQNYFLFFVGFGEGDVGFKFGDKIGPAEILIEFLNV
jgi:hypothetical protein